MDELSVTDDAFVHALDAVEKELIDSYVNGELAGERLERFESGYLASPLRRERVNLARAFVVFARGDAAAATVAGKKSSEKASEPANEARENAGLLFAAREVFSSRPMLRWGFAALALALLVVVGWMVSERARHSRQMTEERERRESPDDVRHTPGQADERAAKVGDVQRAPEDERASNRNTATENEGRGSKENVSDSRARRETLQRRPSPTGLSGVASFILTPQMRGVERVKEVSIPSGASFASVRLELEPNDYDAFSVALIEQPGARTLWRSERLRARTTRDGRSLNVKFPAELLSTGVYMLRVTGVAAEGEPEIVGDYPFRVVE